MNMWNYSMMALFASQRLIFGEVPILAYMVILCSNLSLSTFCYLMKMKAKWKNQSSRY